MKLENANDLFFVLAVLAPGFIFSAVLSQLVPRRQAGTTETLILGYLTGTAFNYAICGFPLYQVLTHGWLAGKPLAQAIVWFGTIFIAPMVLAIIVGAFIQHDWLSWFFKFIRLRWINLIPTGWDWKFSRTGECYVIVTLQNGAVVPAFYGPASMASSDPNQRDLYLERVYTIESDGPWKPVEGSGGIFIEGSQIAYVEFLKGD